MGASISTSRKEESPESSPPDAHEQVQVQQLTVAKATTVVDDYQVFLSFRGPDTRYDFTDILYQHMDGVGIRVFRDDNEIRVGQQIEIILQAIENSEICVPILSEDFASSAWCLREVEKMVDLEKKVMPIFYKVSADDVKLKTKLYKKAMKGHVAKHGKEQVEKWASALKKIAKIKGMEVSAKTRYTEFYKEFVNNVLGELQPRKRCHTDHLVGMDNRIKSAMELLDIGSHDRRYLVIHGMSGTGKTTLANAIFDKLLTKFDNTCFLEDVGESSCRDFQQKLFKGLVHGSIRQSNLSGDIKERFYKRKVLIVLDDVKKWEHIEKLVGRSCWFGAGSIIIVTTKNKDVLNGGALNEDEVMSFEMKTLVDKEAVDLFCWYAFRKTNPPVGFESFSREIIQDAGGLPLTLTVTGALLYKKEENVWRGVISRIKKLRFNNVVVERLRISYDALEDDFKKIFLDIACLRSIAEEKEKSIHMWEACELDPHYGLDVLSSMSLIRIDYGLIWMHSQLKYLGKKIVREESEDPSKRSRLWDHKEAIQVLMSTKGKEKVEALVIEDGTSITLSNEHFASCRELRFLQLAGANIIGDFENLLPNLRWLSWQRCPAVLSATNLFMKNLVNLDLSYSFINESWGGWKLIQILNHLKVLDLTGCKSLTRTPEFCENNSLERLVLWYCCKLGEIHGSIGKLKKLKYLGLLYCDSLSGLPVEIGCLVNLEDLYVSCGSDSYNNTFKLPNSIGFLKSLFVLEITRFGISDIPDSIGGLTKLKQMHLETVRGNVLPNSLGDLQTLYNLRLTITNESKLPINSLGRLVKLHNLDVSGGTNLDEVVVSLGDLQELTTLSLKNGIVRKIPGSIGKLKKLEFLRLDGVEEVPMELWNLPSLRTLELLNSSISTLPSTVSQLKLLEKLDLGTNHMLQELPDLPLSLRTLRVSSRSLRKIANLSRLVNLNILHLETCHQLQELPDLSLSLITLSVSSRSLRKIANLSSLVNLTELQLLGADDYKWPTEMQDSKFEGIEKLVKLKKLHLGIATAKTILQLDLSPLTRLTSFTLVFQPDLDSDSPFLILPATSSLALSIEGKHRRLLRYSKNSIWYNFREVQRVRFSNCLVKDGLDNLGFLQMEKVNRFTVENCPVKLIELACLMKNLMALSILDCGLFKTLPDLSKLEKLAHLDIKDCKDVVDVSGFGSLVSLKRLYIGGCTSLERLEDLSKLKFLSTFILNDCPKLRTIGGIEGLSFSLLKIVKCGSLQNKDELKKRCTEQARIIMD